jgi:hypothetical protein
MTRSLFLVAALLGAASLGDPAVAAEGAPPAPTTTAPTTTAPETATTTAPETAPTTAPTTTAPETAPTTPTASTPADAPATTPPATPMGATADEEYGLKMKELEDSVAELKEQIFRSKAKLTLLTEQVQGGTGAGARIVLTHKNALGGNFLIKEVDYFLDGTPLWQEVDDEGKKITALKEYPLWDGNIIEGSHTLTVEIKLQGDGTGVFQYLQAYQAKMKDSLTFTAEPGKLVTVDVVLFEKGNFTTEMTDRPAIRFDQNVQVDTTKRAPGKTK